MLSPNMSKAARSLLSWSADDLAKAAGVGVATVWRFEGGHSVRAEKADAMQHALASAGLEFIGAGQASIAGGEGLRLKGQG